MLAFFPGASPAAPLLRRQQNNLGGGDTTARVMLCLLAFFTVASAAPVAVLTPPDDLKVKGIAGAVEAAGHPSISLLAGLTKEAGLHASSISLLAGLKEEADLRKKQLAEHREGLEKPWQSRSKSSTALVKLAALSPPPATPPDSAALSADYKALYEQSEARRLAQIKLCDDCKLAEDTLVLALDDAKTKHTTAEDKAVLLAAAATEYIDAKGDYDAKVVEFSNKKSDGVIAFNALTVDSSATDFQALGTMVTDLSTLASEETALKSTMGDKKTAKNTAQITYATAAATAKAADGVADTKDMARSTACAGLAVGPSVAPSPSPAAPPGAPPSPSPAVVTSVPGFLGTNTLGAMNGVEERTYSFAKVWTDPSTADTYSEVMKLGCAALDDLGEYKPICDFPDYPCKSEAPGKSEAPCEAPGEDCDFPTYASIYLGQNSHWTIPAYPGSDPSDNPSGFDAVAKYFDGACCYTGRTDTGLGTGPYKYGRGPPRTLCSKAGAPDKSSWETPEKGQFYLCAKVVTPV